MYDYQVQKKTSRIRFRGDFDEVVRHLTA